MKVIIDDKEIELELTEEQKAAVERALRHPTGWERVERSKTYGYIKSDGVYLEMDCHLDEDDIRYKRANYFNYSELAENIDRAQTLQRKLWRRSAELCDKVDWGDNEKWCIRYAHDIKEFIITDFIRAEQFGQIYFDTEDHAKQVLEEFRDELTWYFTEFKARMD